MLVSGRVQVKRAAGEGVIGLLIGRPKEIGMCLCTSDLRNNIIIKNLLIELDMQQKPNCLKCLADIR